jgi:hypothetical protein
MTTKKKFPSEITNERLEIGSNDFIPITNSSAANRLDKLRGSTLLGLILKLADLVTSWGETPSNSKVPSEKLVKDTLDTKQDRIIENVDITGDSSLQVENIFKQLTLIDAEEQTITVPLNTTTEIPVGSEFYITGENFDLKTIEPEVGVTINNELSKFVLNKNSDKYILKKIATDTWTLTGMITTSLFAGGSGLEGDPYLIATPQHLDNIRHYLNEENIYFKQIADIDLGVAPWNEGEGWNPIGVYDLTDELTASFKGIFDGNDFSINNMMIHKPIREGYDGGGFGLFSNTSGAKLKNINLLNANILIDSVEGTYTKATYKGLLVGYMQNTECENIKATGILQDDIGGSYTTLFAGLTFSSKFLNCSVAGSLIVNAGRGMSYGLFAGRMSSGCYFEDCKASGYIYNNSVTYGYTGGFIGDGSDGIFKRCLANVDIENPANKTYIGGFIGGTTGSSFDRCCALGKVGKDHATQKPKDYTGGFAGSLTSCKVNDCFSKGDVYSTSTTKAGGFVGYISSSKLSNCYSTGFVAGGASTNSGFAGGVTGTNSIENCYWDITTSGNPTSAAGTGYITETLQDFDNAIYDDWDKDVWDIKSGLNNEYPYLTEVETYYFIGQGTEYSPFLISTALELTKLNLIETDGIYFKQNSDIDLVDYSTEDGWTPIGTLIKPFEGIYDGNDKTISNLTINSIYDGSIGLFGFIENGIVKNINFDTSVLYGSSTRGVLAGSVNTSEIINITSINSSFLNNKSISGGLIGLANNSNISNCSVTSANIFGSETTGGIIGKTDTNIISNLEFEGNITVTSSWAGGLIGSSSNDTITNSTVSTSNIVHTASSGNYAFGGAFGYLFNGNVSNISVDNTLISVQATYGGTGGFAGYLDGSFIEKCFSNTEVSGKIRTGGFAGALINSTIKNSFSSGSVTRLAGATYENIGSFIGELGATYLSTENVIIENCYTVSLLTYAGTTSPTDKGFIGDIIGTPTITSESNYFDTDTTGQLTDPTGIAVAKSEAEMKAQATFVDWDFVDIWEIVEGVSRPTLRSI